MGDRRLGKGSFIYVIYHVGGHAFQANTSHIQRGEIKEQNFISCTLSCIFVYTWRFIWCMVGFGVFVCLCEGCLIMYVQIVLKLHLMLNQIIIS